MGWIDILAYGVVLTMTALCYIMFSQGWIFSKPTSLRGIAGFVIIGSVIILSPIWFSAFYFTPKHWPDATDAAKSELSSVVAVAVIVVYTVAMALGIVLKPDRKPA
jgi:hypothetical protein